MPANTYLRAYERIYEVLIDGAGNKRALAAADRFARGHTPGLPAKLRSVRAKARPTVFVVIASAEPEPGAVGEIAEQQDYRIIVSIYRDHWLRYQGNPTGVELQLVASNDAFAKIRGALCWPGNLKETEEGRNTGFAGEALNAKGAQSKQLRITNLGDEGRVIHYLDQFEAEFEWEFLDTLLLEDGAFLLNEAGGRLLLES